MVRLGRLLRHIMSLSFACEAFAKAERLLEFTHSVQHPLQRELSQLLRETDEMM